MNVVIVAVLIGQYGYSSFLRAHKWSHSFKSKIFGIINSIPHLGDYNYPYFKALKAKLISGPLKLIGKTKKDFRGFLIHLSITYPKRIKSKEGYLGLKSP